MRCPLTFTRTRSALVAAVMLGLMLLPSATASAEASAEAAAPTPTLYQRLGGYDEIASFIALVFPRVAQHPELRHMFRGHGNDSQQRQFQLVVEMICQRTGGPCVYLGRPMPPVHDGLGITEANWATFMKIITDGMQAKRYSPELRAEFLEVWRGFRDGVVQKGS